MKRHNFLTLACGALFLLAPVAISAQVKPLETSGRDFVTLLSKGDFASAVARFDSTMKKALPEPQLRQVWQSLEGQAGAFKSQGQARVLKQGGYDIVLVTCQFAKTSLDAKVVFNAEREIAGLFFVPSVAPARGGPPSYARTNSFAETEVKIGTGEWVLPGTLTVPRSGPRPCPAVVLVHGSGPEDRDETLGANKPLRDLAWGLASKGIAVLRYEKRTKQYGMKVLTGGKLTLQEETVDDALQAVALLRKTQGLDPSRVFVLGHSLGGMAAPRIGKADPRIAGLIILAGSTRPLEDLMVDQTRYLLSHDGKLSPEAEARLAELEGEVRKVKDLKPGDTSTALVLGAPPAYWLDLRAYDPVATARNLKQPILILQGGRDYQVTEADFDGWKKGLNSIPSVTFKLYPKLNHLFMSGEGKSMPAEYDRPSEVAPVVIEDVAAWIGSYKP